MSAQSNIAVKVRDLASRPLIKISRNAKKLNRDFQETSRALARLERRAQRLKKAMRGLGIASKAAGIATAVGFGHAIREFARYEFEVKKIQGRISKELEKNPTLIKNISKEIREVAKTSLFTPVQVAEGFGNLIAGGIDPKTARVLNPIALSLASGLGEEPGSASDAMVTISNIVNSIGKSENDFRRMADMLAVSVTRGPIKSLPEIFESFTKFAPQLNEMELNKLLALSTVAKKLNPQSQSMGLAIKKLVETITKDTPSINKMLREVGLSRGDIAKSIDVRDAERNLYVINDIFPILEAFHKSVGNLGGIDRFQKIFGGRHGGNILAFVRNFEEIDRFAEVIADSQGTVAKLELEKKNSVLGRWKLLVSAFSDFEISLFDDIKQTDAGLGREVSTLLESLTEIVESVSAFSAATKRAGVYGGLGVLGIGIASMIGGALGMLGVSGAGVLAGAAVATPLALKGAIALFLFNTLSASLDALHEPAFVKNMGQDLLPRIWALFKGTIWTIFESFFAMIEEVMPRGILEKEISSLKNFFGGLADYNAHRIREGSDSASQISRSGIPYQAHGGAPAIKSIISDAVGKIFDPTKTSTGHGVYFDETQVRKEISDATTPLRGSEAQSENINGNADLTITVEKNGSLNVSELENNIKGLNVHTLIPQAGF